MVLLVEADTPRSVDSCAFPHAAWSSWGIPPFYLTRRHSAGFSSCTETPRNTSSYTSSHHHQQHQTHAPDPRLSSQNQQILSAQDRSRDQFPGYFTFSLFSSPRTAWSTNWAASQGSPNHHVLLPGVTLRTSGGEPSPHAKSAARDAQSATISNRHAPSASRSAPHASRPRQTSPALTGQASRYWSAWMSWNG